MGAVTSFHDQLGQWRVKELEPELTGRARAEKGITIG